MQWINLRNGIGTCHDLQWDFLTRLHRNYINKKTNKSTNRRMSLILLAHPAGLEPAACGFEVRRSIQLSYGCMPYIFTFYIIKMIVATSPKEMLINCLCGRIAALRGARNLGIFLCMGSRFLRSVRLALRCIPHGQLFSISLMKHSGQEGFSCKSR